MIHCKEDTIVVLDESVIKIGEYFKNYEIWENQAHMIPVEDIPRYADSVRSFL
jgi:hypothetical protein